MPNKLFKKQSGFTVIEMLVVTFIIGMITVLAIVNFRKGARAENLRIGATKLASVIREAQNRAMNGIPAETVDGDTAIAPAYGVHFSLPQIGAPSGFGGGMGEMFMGSSKYPPEKFVLFADTGGCDNSGPPDGIYNDGEALVGGIYDFPPEVKISDLTPQCEDENLDIIFTPPKPITSFSWHSSSYQEAIIELIHKKTGQTREVTVNRISGKISH